MPASVRRRAPSAERVAGWARSWFLNTTITLCGDPCGAGDADDESTGTNATKHTAPAAIAILTLTPIPPSHVVAPVPETVPATYNVIVALSTQVCCADRGQAAEGCRRESSKLG